jgi:hypothetical protein
VGSALSTPDFSHGRGSRPKKLHTRPRHRHGKPERRHGPSFYVKSPWERRTRRLRPLLSA